MLFWLIFVPVAAVIVSALLSWWNSNLDSEGFWIGIAFCWIGTAVTILVFTILAFSYVGAAREAQVLNAKYGTTYNQDDLFWAGGTIKQIIEGPRQRIDVTGIK